MEGDSVADGEEASVPDAAGISWGAGGGETAGLAAEVPVAAGFGMRAGMGELWGMSGVATSGWIGMGAVLGAFCTGVATEGEASGTGVAVGVGAEVSSAGASGARSQADKMAARNNTRTRFMITPLPLEYSRI